MTADLLRMAVGLTVLVLGANWLVRGSVSLAGRAGLSPLLIGLTVVAFGTSMPEVAVSVQAGMAGQGEIVLGNVLGSNVFNILAILGLSALVAPRAGGLPGARLGQLADSRGPDPGPGP